MCITDVVRKASRDVKTKKVKTKLKLKLKCTRKS